MDLEELLRERGTLTRRDLADLGLSRRAIEAVFAKYPRPRRNLIADPNLSPQAAEALRLTAALTCVSAAEFSGHWVLRPPSGLHLATPHGHALKACRFAVVRHRTSHASRLVVDPLQMCLHAAACLDPVEAAVIIESSVVKRQVTLDELRSRLGNRRGQGARRALDLVRGVADSPIEVVVRTILLGAGIDFVEQPVLPNIGRVDFLLAGRLIVELDGWQWHGNRDAWQNDMRRDQRAAQAGYRSVRFSAAQVLHQPEYVLETIQQAVLVADFVRVSPLSQGDDLDAIC